MGLPTFSEFLVCSNGFYYYFYGFLMGLKWSSTMFNASTDGVLMGFNDEYSSQLTVEWPISNSTWKSPQKEICVLFQYGTLDFSVPARSVWMSFFHQAIQQQLLQRAEVGSGIEKWGDSSSENGHVADVLGTWDILLGKVTAWDVQPSHTRILSR